LAGFLVLEGHGESVPLALRPLLVSHGPASEPGTTSTATIVKTTTRTFLQLRVQVMGVPLSFLGHSSSIDRLGDYDVLRINSSIASDRSQRLA
jgi:hypothetical protein